MDTKNFTDNLMRQAEENPLMALGVAAGLITSLSKFVEASGRRKSTLAYAKQAEAKLKAAQNAAKK